eukprot:TRINITY_DN7123_c0_g1_i2.p1 TRINITY_DN7123_c0_g1~~TRINITY_DN7123_c0_g1_i2.p1  ORF type:complete len:1413 (+),score=361.26 TRINITY_DN7123_c0_g1_i2:89-4327(+)
MQQVTAIGRYRVSDEVAPGLWRARSPSGEPLLLAELPLGGCSAAELMRDCQRLSAARHPALVGVVDTFEATPGESVAVVTEMCDPTATVATLLLDGGGGQPGLAAAWGVLIGAAQGLVQAHEAGLAHGALSKYAVLAAGVAEGGAARVLPPCLCPAAQPPPEVAAGGAWEPKSDVWSLGQLVNSLVSIAVIGGDGAMELSFLVRKMCDPEPARRPGLRQVLNYSAVKVRIQQLRLRDEEARVAAQRADADAASRAAERRAADAEARAAALQVETTHLRARVAELEELLRQRGSGCRDCAAAAERSERLAARERAADERESRLVTFLKLYSITKRQLDRMPTDAAHAQLFCDYYKLPRPGPGSPGQSADASIPSPPPKAVRADAAAGALQPPELSSISPGSAHAASEVSALLLRHGYPGGGPSRAPDGEPPAGDVTASLSAASCSRALFPAGSSALRDSHSAADPLGALRSSEAAVTPAPQSPVAAVSPRKGVGGSPVRLSRDSAGSAAAAACYALCMAAASPSGTWRGAEGLPQAGGSTLGVTVGSSEAMMRPPGTSDGGTFAGAAAPGEEVPITLCSLVSTDMPGGQRSPGGSGSGAESAAAETGSSAGSSSPRAECTAADDTLATAATSAPEGSSPAAPPAPGGSPDQPTAAGSSAPPQEAPQPQPPEISAGNSIADSSAVPPPPQGADLSRASSAATVSARGAHDARAAALACLMGPADPQLAQIAAAIALAAGSRLVEAGVGADLPLALRDVLFVSACSATCRQAQRLLPRANCVRAAAAPERLAPLAAPDRGFCVVCLDCAAPLPAPAAAAVARLRTAPGVVVCLCGDAGADPPPHHCAADACVTAQVRADAAAELLRATPDTGEEAVSAAVALAGRGPPDPAAAAQQQQPGCPREALRSALWELRSRHPSAWQTRCQGGQLCPAPPYFAAAARWLVGAAGGGGPQRCSQERTAEQQQQHAPPPCTPPRPGPGRGPQRPSAYEEGLSRRLQASPDARSRTTSATGGVSPLDRCRVNAEGEVVKPWQQRSMQDSLRAQMAVLADLEREHHGAGVRRQAGGRRAPLGTAAPEADVDPPAPSSSLSGFDAVLAAQQAVAAAALAASEHPSPLDFSAGDEDALPAPERLGNKTSQMDFSTDTPNDLAVPLRSTVNRTSQLDFSGATGAVSYDRDASTSYTTGPSHADCSVSGAADGRPTARAPPYVAPRDRQQPLRPYLSPGRSQYSQRSYHPGEGPSPSRSQQQRRRAGPSAGASPATTGRSLGAVGATPRPRGGSPSAPPSPPVALSPHTAASSGGAGGSRAQRGQRSASAASRPLSFATDTSGMSQRSGGRSAPGPAATSSSMSGASASADGSRAAAGTGRARRPPPPPTRHDSTSEDSDAEDAVAMLRRLRAERRRSPGSATQPRCP